MEFIADGVAIRAHKAVLAASWQLFRQILNLTCVHDRELVGPRWHVSADKINKGEVRGFTKVVVGLALEGFRLTSWYSAKRPAECFA